MSNVVSMEDYRPHAVISSGRSVHVIPLSVLEDIATGDLRVDQLDGWEEIIPEIIGEWLCLIED